MDFDPDRWPMLREAAWARLDQDADDDDIDAEARRLEAADWLFDHRRLFHGGIEKPETCATCVWLQRAATP